MIINVNICMFYAYTDPITGKAHPENFLKIIKNNTVKQSEKIKENFPDLFQDFYWRISKLMINNNKNIFVIFPPTKKGKYNRMTSWKTILEKDFPSIVFSEIKTPDYSSPNNNNNNIEKIKLNEIPKTDIKIEFSRKLVENQENLLIFIDDIYTKGDTSSFCLEKILEEIKKFNTNKNKFHVICMAKKKEIDNDYYEEDVSKYKINEELNPIYREYQNKMKSNQ